MKFKKKSLKFFICHIFIILRFLRVRVYSQSLLKMGVSLEDIQSLLGHQDITTTQRRYAQHARPDLLDKGSKIDNVIKIKRVG